MKKFKNIILISILLTCGTLISCEQWLDVTSDNEIRAEDQFDSEAGFKDALMGIYIKMTSSSLYSKDMTWNLADLLSQQYADLSDLAVYSDIQDFNYNTTKASDQIYTIWTEMYNCIANINNELSFIEKNGDILQPVNYSLIKGELLGLRAFLHFDLMRLFGHSNIANRSDRDQLYAIPYVRRANKELTPQKGYDETFSVMMSDIDEALELLKEDPLYNPDRSPDFYRNINNDDFYENRENRMNYYAVLALKARLLMWYGGQENIEKAGEIAETVIANSNADLITPESYNITNDPVLYPEHLFNLDITAFDDIVDKYLKADDATQYNAIYLTFAYAEETYEADNINIGGVDIRYNTLLENQSLGKVCIKLRQGSTGTNNNSHPGIMPLIKLSEMYYIAAESNIEKNTPDLKKAVSLLNYVRSHRGILEDIPEDAGVETLENELLKEYQKEFVNEGQLFFYYKRNGLESFRGISEEVTVNDNIYMLPFPDSEFEFGRIQ